MGELSENTYLQPPPLHDTRTVCQSPEATQAAVQPSSFTASLALEILTLLTRPTNTSSQPKTINTALPVQKSASRLSHPRCRIVMHFHRAITPASAVSDLLDGAIAFVHHRAATGFSDIVIGPVGYHRLGARALTLTAEGQRLTWGVLALALVEVRAWMDEPGRAYGTGSFEIWVGNVRFGDGGISVDA
ncbi:hypothetical protein G7Y79_00001g002910 [Physcia stellaris]|nr:hypothetical protein G7Y79_00001g002910 [Physcia stellaris]